MRLKEIEEAKMARNNFRNLLNINLEDIEPGRALLSIAVTDQLLQAGGNVHGGVFAVLVDSAIGSAARSVIDENHFGVTTDMNLNFIRGAKDGTIYAEGKVVSRGSLLIVGTCDVRDGDGKLLATGRATYLIRERRS